MHRILSVVALIGFTVTFSSGDSIDEPLFLTSLMQDKSRPRQEIQNMARVDPSQFLGVKSFAGYLTVDEKYNSNMFFWYFPPEQNASNAPVVLWLQGGPGFPSLFGLYMELGPFEIDANGRLQKRNYTWSRDHHLIFIDNPVGCGLSFTEDDAGYAINEEDVGKNLHEAMMQLYELFEWTGSDFWITGESYAGKYEPALAYYIHKAQTAKKARVHIPLKGLAIGNGLCDPINQLTYGDYLYQLGLIDEHGLKKFHKAEQMIANHIKNRDFQSAFDGFDELINGDFRNDTIFTNLTGFQFKYNYLNAVFDDGQERMEKFMAQSIVRSALHVGSRPFVGINMTVYEKIKLDVMDTVAPWLSELLNYYKICFYNGQMDILIAYPTTRNFLQNFEFAAAEEYKTAKRNIWYVDDEIAGYVKKAGNLIEVMVRNAGHMVPADQPRHSYNLLYQLTHFNTVD